MFKKCFFTVISLGCLSILLLAQELPEQKEFALQEEITSQTEEQTQEIQLTPEVQLTQSPPEVAQPTAETRNLSFPETITNYNLLKNSSFESFSEGQDKAPDSWNISKLKISRDKNNPKFDSYAARITYKRQEGSLSQDISEVDNLKGKTLTFGCWVKASTPDQVRISLDDGISTTYSGYHSGEGDFEFLSLTTTLSDSATNLKVAINLDSKGTVYADGACLYELITEATYIPNPQDDLKMPSNLIFTDLNNQFVGIAIDKPQLRLDVNGPLRIQNIWSVSPTLGEGLELLYDTSTQSALIQAYDRANNFLKDLYLQNNQFLFTADGRLEVQGDIKATGNIYKGVGEGNEVLTQTTADPLYINQTGSETLDGNLAITGNLIVDGYLGVGTTPSEKIEVLGNVKATKFLGNGSELTNLPLLWTKTESGNIYYEQGNVGIGTIEPSSKLDVNGITTSAGVQLASSGNVFSTYNNQITIGDQVGVVSRGKGIIVRDGTGTTDLGYLGYDGSGYFSGNVGIGTAEPAAKLHVVPSMSQRGIQITGNNDSEIYVSGSDAFNIFSEENMYLRTDTGKELHFGSNNVDSQMVLKNGNVGIGITSPKSALHIQGAYPNIILSKNNNNGEEVGVAVLEVNSGYSGAYNGLFIASYSANKDLILPSWAVDIGGYSTETYPDSYDTFNILRYPGSGSGGFTRLFTINGSGNVGIGKTDPNYKLDVNGDIRVSGNIISEGDICIGKCD